MPLLKSYEDEEAFERLYRQYVRLMLQTAYQILHNKQDAEDAVQTAFLRIATHFSGVEKNICPKTANQFVIIVRNIAIDIYRKKKREVSAPLLEETVSEDFHANTLDEAMQALPQSMRDILYLHHIYGLSVKEIAKLLGLKTDAVYKRLQRAAARLRQIMEEG
ncbi:MAG: sigma-70 family RNA polymerase sigma factor [Oscillospiraceae bacterium]|nr:sigma-70 family RNA polymerase sigma factor [Oscillospiraceae bacterium]